MVQMDWDRIRSVKAVSLADEEIEDLFPMVVKCDIEEVDDIHNLRAIMKLSQEMLQYKDNQVESLLLECDELKEKVSTAVSTAAKSTKKGIQDDAIEEDNNDTRLKDSSMTEYYEDALRIKNDKIKTLMLELEGIENENIDLKEKLESLKEEMEDATESMDSMTDELKNLRSKSILYKDEIDRLKHEKTALLTQIEEIATQQIDRDKIIDEFGAAIDVRVTEWQGILENKNAEISHLKEELLRSQTHPNLSMKDNNIASQISYLNDEIEKRDKVISELESKLSEASVEMNESAALIEKLKADTKKMEKSGKRREQKELLNKVQEAHGKIIVLQEGLKQAEEALTVKSQQLCEVLDTLRKYEDKDQGLTETINEVKELKIQLTSKNDHIQDLVSVINKLEGLSSHQEMQIAALREKLGMPDEEEISIEGVALKHQEEIQKKNQLIHQNSTLEQENLDLKSDIRTLKYKLSKLGEKLITAKDTPGSQKKSHPSENSSMNWVADQEIISMRHKAEINELHDNVRIVIEENEALRKGMHEILDSIRNQDGQSMVEVQSDTLEKLLEALDVRHLAGWYHPAMRLQERLNVVQGSNNELRALLKHMKKEMQRKDDLLRCIALKQDSKSDNNSNNNHKSDNRNPEVSESENEDVKTIVTEMQRIQSVYRDELTQWEQERESLNHEKEELTREIEEMRAQLDIFETDFKAIETGTEEVQKALVFRSRENAESALKLIISNRKFAAVEDLLNKETAKSYNIQKEVVAAESTYKKIVADMDKRHKLMENRMRTLESNLSNSITLMEYNELKEKFEEAKVQFRSSYELKLALSMNEEMKISRDRSEFSENDKNEQSSIREVCAINLELREQLVQVQNLLSKNLRFPDQKSRDEKELSELQEEMKTMQIENENLLRTLTISREEAQMHYTMNSLKTLELDSLRHQLLDLQAISEDKETIAKLGFELNKCKVAEIEISRRKMQLDTEISQLRNDLEIANRKCDEAKIEFNEFRRRCEIQCKNYEETLSFLQNQYVGSTSMTSLQRYENMLEKLAKDRDEVDLKLKLTKEAEENAKIHQETLTNRLEIVERLKDILEQQIGSPDVQSLMDRFSESSQKDLNEYRLKRRITQLEVELQITVKKLTEYESTISSMEYDIVNTQKYWKKKEETLPTAIIETELQEPEKLLKPEKKSVFTEARVESQSVEVQSDPIIFPPSVITETISRLPEPIVEKIASNDNVESHEKVTFLQDQLKQALVLASDRSAKLIKYESQIAEYQAKIGVLDKAMADKDMQMVEQNKLVGLKQNGTNGSRTGSGETEGTDKVALKSTVNSLQKIISQKEETILRYQNLLKEDRDEHSKAAARLQDEIKNQRIEISMLKDELEKRTEFTTHVPERDISESKTEKTLNESKRETRPDLEVEEKIARLYEQVSTLEADLNISRELGERWHRLAEERLQHMDYMRERLEAQHKNELDSYRSELDKWQSEASALRQSLSENRVKLTRGNISLSKELQERDSRIEELTEAYQHLQNEFEMMESMTQSQQPSIHSANSMKIQEISHSLGRESTHLQTEVDLLRRQQKSITEKEKLYKDQIVDLKQQLSRRYMAEKSEERKTSHRELQLEKKLKSMEEELNKARVQLDHEYRVQEAKRVKTAEELSLWEKQKKWQQIAEKLKRELKEKAEEYKKLSTSHEKLKAVVSCMEREKWYLRSKLRSENGSVLGGLTTRPDLNFKLIEDLQTECQTLRGRMTELTNRLESEDHHELILTVEKQKRRIEALEAVTKGNAYVVDQLEKLEAAKSALEKTNIRLESENFELRMEMEKVNNDTPRLKEKVEHLEKYVELLKIEKSSDSSPRSSEKEQEHGSKKSVSELERTIFILKRIVEKLQAENKRLRLSSKSNHRIMKPASSSISKISAIENNSSYKKQYEQAKKRVVTLEADLHLAEQRIVMLEIARKEEDNSDEVEILKHQLAHKSELLDKMKQLLARAAINEKALRQRIQQIELKQTLSTIPECHSPSAISDRLN